MRKSFVLFGLAFLLAVGFLPCAHAVVDDEKDEVTFREETLWGDPAAAGGLTVEAATHMDYHLFWTTDFWPGTERPSKTEFEFSSEQRSEIYRDDASLEVGFSSGNFGSSGVIDLEEMKGDESLHQGSGGMWEPVIDVASRTKSGDQRTETVSLAEYYQYYPMFAEGRLPWDEDGSYYWIEPTREAYDKLTQYFAVPVPDNAKLTVTVVKDEGGNVVGVTCNETEDYVLGYVWYEGVMTAEGGYFVMSRGRSGEEEPKLFKSLPRLSSDYGIYFFPLKQYQDDPSRKTPDMAKLCNAFPIQGDGDALDLRYDRDRDQLLLLAEEQGRLWLTVIDRKTMEQRQRVELGSIADSEFILGWSVQSQQMLVALTEQYDETERLPSKRIVFLEWSADGWTVQMRSPLTWPGQEEEQMFYNMEQSMRMAYDGKRLALVQWQEYYDPCQINLWLCEDGALAYAGTYWRENTRGSVDDYDSSIRPRNSEGGLTASWDDKQ